MKILYKRILIMFSVALNIGFIAMAITMACNHSISHHQRSWNELVHIVRHLDLPQTQENKVIESIKQFGTVVDRQHGDVKKARDSILALLAKDGPVNPDELHRTILSVDRQEALKNKAFETHVLELRSLLGDEKGAQYFSALLEHVRNRDKLPQ